PPACQPPKIMGLISILERPRVRFCTSLFSFRGTVKKSAVPFYPLCPLFIPRRRPKGSPGLEMPG
ncbi:MAG: hypothetical protein M3Y28_08545, partial [Armatimonadota bacterium]|nr:hypothetical protein [Armatimonadota bacterium]